MINVGILGLGNIGSQVYSLICQRRYLNKEIRIVKVYDVEKKRYKDLNVPRPLKANSSRDITRNPHIDVVVELIGGLHPAREIIVDSLKHNKHIVSANKHLLAYFGKSLFSLASQKNLSIGFEASVCAGIPIIDILRHTLLPDKVRGFKGIINGTTNFILDLMENQHIDFREALNVAQKKGIAERNPVLDIEGRDSLHKLIILNYLCFGIWVSPRDVLCQGVGDIQGLDVVFAKELGYSVKLLAVSRLEKNRLYTYVSPALVSHRHPLSGIREDFNALFLDTDLAGNLLFYGKGAGRLPTSSAVITDLLRIKNIDSPKRRHLKPQMADSQNLRSRFYIRFMAKDRPGVLAKISSILASYNISISSVTQKERSITSVVPIVMLTHEAVYKDLNAALEKIDRLNVIKGRSVCIRIEA